MNMALPAYRFAHPAMIGMALWLPPALAGHEALAASPTPTPPPATLPVLPMPAPIACAVEITELLAASGNLGPGGQQFWLGRSMPDGRSRHRPAPPWCTCCLTGFI
jgi:hypothetical protein